MKIGIYDPYLDTLGGGEKYIFDIAQCLSKADQVTVFWDDVKILEKAEERFGKKFTNINLKSNVFSSNIIKKYIATSSFDLFFYISDGSIPFLFAKKNYLILQFP